MTTLVRPRTFTPVDATWLRMEVPTSTTVIAGLLLFDEPVDFSRLREQIAERLLRFDRFRQRPRPPVLPLTLPVWEPDRHFDLDAHLHRTALSDPGGWPELKAFIEGLLAEPLPRERSQWQMHLIERYGSGSALVICFSHIMADGFASMYLLDAITDSSADVRPSPRSLEPPAPGGPLAAALAVVDAARRGLDLARDPVRALRLAGTVLESAGILGSYVLMLPDAPNLLRAPSTHCKRVAATEPIPLADVKGVARAFQATVNDVIGSSAAGAIRRYLVSRGAQVNGLTIRAMMPYNLRPVERRAELGNGFSIVPLPLPIGIADPVERLLAVKCKADFIKSRPEAPVGFAVLSSAGFLPKQLSRLAVRFFAWKASAVFTNVPGLPEARYLAGRRIGRVMFWVPTSSGFNLGVSILTYAGDATVCFRSDASVVPDIEAMAASFVAEFAELQARARVRSAEVAPVTPDALAAGGQAAGLAQAAAKVEIAEPSLPDVTPPAPLPELVPVFEPGLALGRCRCQAVTKAGRPCRNYALPGSNYCRTHAGLALFG